MTFDGVILYSEPLHFSDLVATSNFFIESIVAASWSVLLQSIRSELNDRLLEKNTSYSFSAHSFGVLCFTTFTVMVLRAAVFNAQALKAGCKLPAQHHVAHRDS